MEVPEFKRCCCCLPLRRGLITWGYGKIMLDLFIIIANIVTMVDRYFDYNMTAFTFCFLFFVDLILAVAFVVGAHKKMYKCLRIYFFYCIVWLLLVLTFYSYVAYLHTLLIIEYNDYHWRSTFKFIITGFSATFVQVYVILLLRSEYKKLRSESHPVHYTNNAAEAGAQNIPLEYKGNHASDNTDRAITNDNDKQLE